MRFSMKMLLAAFAFVAVSCASLIYANRTLAACCFTAAFIAVLLSIVAMLIRRGPERAFWVGFAVFAGAYFWYSMLGERLLEIDASGQGGYWQEPKLATSAVLLWLDDSLRRAGNGSRRTDVRGLYGDGSYRTTFSGGSSVHALLVGHSTFTLIFGLAGGLTGRLLYNREVKRKTEDK